MHQLVASELLRDLNTRRVGRRIVVIPEIDSTNSHALAAAASFTADEQDGSVVFAERQTAGRGRLGRSWHSPTGASLLFTVLLREKGSPMQPFYWIAAAAVAVVRGIRSATDVTPVIRWPNDVYVGEKKLAGILVETRRTEGPPDVERSAETNGDSWAVAIGIGVNCFQHAGHFSEEVRGKATSLELASSQPVDRTAVGRAILQALDHYLALPGERYTEVLAAEWAEHSADIGSRARLRHEGHEYSGQIVDVDPELGLVMQLDTGARKHFDPSVTTRL